MKIVGECKACGQCCNFHYWAYSEADTNIDFLNRYFEKVKVFKDVPNTEWVLVMIYDVQCKLLKDGKCSVHKNKPESCKDYPFNWEPEQFAAIRSEGCGFEVVEDD